MWGKSDKKGIKESILSLTRNAGSITRKVVKDFKEGYRQTSSNKGKDSDKVKRK